MVIHGFTGINGMRVNVGLISIIASITSSILPNDRRFDAMGPIDQTTWRLPQPTPGVVFLWSTGATYG